LPLQKGEGEELCDKEGEPGVLFPRPESEKEGKTTTNLGKTAFRRGKSPQKGRKQASARKKSVGRRVVVQKEAYLPQGKAQERERTYWFLKEKERGKITGGTRGECRHEARERNARSLQKGVGEKKKPILRKKKRERGALERP